MLSPPDWTPYYSEAQLLQFPRAAPTAGWTAQGMREPPDRSNRAGWSSGNYLVLRAISRRITGHADGSLKGQMASTGAERDDPGHGNAGWTCTRHLIECTSELDALHAGIRNPRYTDRQGQARQGGLLFFQFFSISPSVVFNSVSGSSPFPSTQGTFTNSLSPSPVPLPACLPPENLLVFFGACPHVTLLLPLASSFFL